MLGGDDFDNTVEDLFAGLNSALSGLSGLVGSYDNPGNSVAEIEGIRATVVELDSRRKSFEQIAQSGKVAA
jgi:hypothetical protein